MAYVWMEVSKDRYRLPIAVANTARELALICGVEESNIVCAASRDKGTERRRFIRIIVEDEK